MKKNVLLLFFIFIAADSFSQAPSWLWSEAPSGGKCYEAGVGISADATGNIFMSGRFNGSITLGGESATSSGVTVVSGELNTSGSFSWLTSHSYSGKMEYVYGFTRSDSDNTYTTGKIGSDTGGIYVDKYNSSGSLIWSKIVSGGGIGAGYGIAVDASGNVFVTGEYSGSVIFGSTTLTSLGESDIFLAKYNSSGTCQWAVRAGGTSYDGARGIVLDKSGNIYICGGYIGSPSFGSIKPVPASSYPNFFIAKYNSSGTSQWVNAATNSGFSNDDPFWRMQSIAIDTCANLYVTGHYRGNASFGSITLADMGIENIFVAKCLNIGQWDWVSRAGGKGYDNGTGITLDKNYDIYVTGSFQDTAQFGNYWVSSSGLSDVFVAKYSNSSGDVQWVQTGGGKANDAGIGITLDNNGYAYIIGTSGTGSFGTHSITDATGCGSIFIAKLDTSAPLRITVNADTFYCAGVNSNLPFTTEGTFNSGNIFTAQISDANGLFSGSSSQNIGSVTATSGGIISVTIPSAFNGHYRIRIVSSNPALSSYSSSCTQLIRIGLPGGSPGIITAVRDTLCQGLPANLTLSGSSGGLIQWQYDSTLTNFSNISGATSSTYHSFDLFHIGSNYFRALVDIGGCPIASTPYPIFVPIPLISSFYGTFSKNVETYNSDSSTGDIRIWYWGFGDGSSSYLQNPTHSYVDSGVYYVCLTLYNGSNCSYTFCRFITIPLYMDITPSSSYTRGVTNTVPLFMNGNFNSGNTFTAQLSDVYHSFSSPTTIGTLTATTSTSINILIPTTVATGHTYDMRIISSNPVRTSLVHLISE